MAQMPTLLLLLVVVVVVLLAAAALVVGTPVSSQWMGVTCCPSSALFSCTSSSAFNKVLSSR
jgi:hypothetical protein